ncbi:MAG: replication-associated recombination protein A [Candidatus Saccharimonadales bacterium]
MTGDNAGVPLAEQLRPTSLAEVVGHKSLLADGQLLQQIIAGNQLVSLILWGPPGSGKTTLARLVANQAAADFIEISAVTSGLPEVKNIIKRAEANQRLRMPTVLFVDEIHRFNKAQQDAFLPHVESGLLTLIGATTENPSFEVITPLLSRSRVLVLEALTKADILAILQRAIKRLKVSKQLDKQGLDYLAELAAGDARVALGNLELALNMAGGSKLTIELVKNAAQRKLPGYDKNGDQHYQQISAFIKSLRASDADASLYYLARILGGGEDPKFVARRMVVFASEDVGLAASAALNLAVSTFLAVERLGMPECQYNLYHCALVLAKTAKSRSVTSAMNKAQAAAEQFAEEPVPLHLRNATSQLDKDRGYGKNYQWKDGFKHPAGNLPEALKDLKIFED